MAQPPGAGNDGLGAPAEPGRGGSEVLDGGMLGDDQPLDAGSDAGVGDAGMGDAGVLDAAVDAEAGANSGAAADQQAGEGASR